MIQEYVNMLHSYVSGNVDTSLGKLASALWSVFSLVNGNPEITNYGIRLTLMLFFALFLITVLQLRTKLIFDKKHLVAYIGSLFLVFRIFVMIGFEWGWQIGLYDDWILHLLSPPLEHFFNMIFFGCMAYYTLNVYDYYPGLIKKIVWYIPLGFLLFFIYSTIEWKFYFMSKLPEIVKYNTCMSDWQNHLIVTIISMYVFWVAIHKYKKYHMFLAGFWTVTLVEHYFRFIAFYNHYEPPELAAIFHALGTWSLPILILHFVNAYIKRNDELPKARKPIVFKYTETESCK